MGYRFVAAGLMGLSLLANSVWSGDAGELEQLKGKWKVTAFLADGTSERKETIAAMTFTFAGDKMGMESAREDCHVGIV